MVGRMPKKQIDSQKFALQFSAQDAEPETPQQRRAIIAAAQQSSNSYQSSIAEHDAREERRMFELSRRAKTNMLSLNDLMGDMGPPLARSDVMLPEMNTPGQQFLTEDFPTNHDDVIMEDLYRQPRPMRQPVQQPERQPRPMPQRQVLQETKPIRSSDIYRSDGSGRKVTEAPRPAVRQALMGENWKVKRYLGETRSGAEVHVWKVENIKTGSSLRNLFRLEGVANRVAMMLNESGDNNDPRVVSLVGAYEKRDKLLKEARALEKTADGKAMKTERLRQIRAEINQLDYRLGV